MEWGLPKLAIIMLSIIILALMLNFCTEFGKVLEKDKIIQDSINKDRINEIKESIPSTVTGIIISQISLDKR